MSSRPLVPPSAVPPCALSPAASALRLLVSATLLGGLLGTSATAFARELPFADKLGSVGTIEIKDKVEVPLVLDGGGHPISAVEVVINGKADKPTAFFNLASSLSIITVSEDFAETHGLEVQTANKKLIAPQSWKHKRRLYAEELEGTHFRGGYKVQYVEIESLTIGGLVLKDVVAFVNNDTIDLSEHGDLTIGMGALPGVAYAVLPSEGKVQFAPAAQGAAMVEALGGGKIKFAERGWELAEWGLTGRRLPLHDQKQKVVLGARTLLIPVEVGGQKLVAAWETGAEGAMVTPNERLEGTARLEKGDQRSVWTSVALEGVPQTHAWIQPDGAFNVLPEAGLKGTLGAPFTSGYDLAVDPVGHTLALRPATAQKRVDRRPETLAAKLTQAAAADKEAAEKAAKDGKPAKPAGKAWGKVAAAHANVGDQKSAAEAQQKVIAADDSSCAAWQKLGGYQQAAGDLDGALASVTKAAELYHAWWDRPFEERQRLSKALGKAGPDQDVQDDKGAVVKSQPASCHTADGDLAALLSVKGDLAAVQKLYTERLDLDPGLAVAAGSAQLAAGKTEAAVESYRQAMRLEGKPRAGARLGLGLIYAGRGDLDTAAPLFAKALEANPKDARALDLWLDSVNQTKGAEAARAAASDFARSHPDYATAIYGLAREAKRAGDTDALGKVQSKGDTFFKAELALTPADTGLLAVYARYLVLTGRLDEADKAVAAALQSDSGSAAAWLAKAELLQARGATEGVQQALARAALSSPTHPGYATLNKR